MYYYNKPFKGGVSDSGEFHHLDKSVYRLNNDTASNITKVS